MRHAVLAAIILTVLALSGAVGAPASATSLLGAGQEGTAPATAEKADGQGTALGGTRSSQGWVATLPGPLRDAIAWTARQQLAFNQALRAHIAAYHEQGALLPALALIGLSFLYGVFHAVGPGHGKAVISTYFLAREATIRRGLALGALIAAIQAVSAIVIVGGLGLVLAGSRTAILGAMPVVEMVSYALVLALGLAMTWAALTGRECGHDHGHGGHDHDGHDHDHACGHHHHGHAHAHGHHDEAAARLGSRWEYLSAAVVAGLRPCTGALIVLFFALGNGIFLIGALSAVAMAVGVSITISAIGVAAILARRGLLRVGAIGAGEGRAAARVALSMRVLAVTGSLAVAAVGALLLMGAASRGGAL
ncbi:high frequency lysogenization protein HflD [Marivibrio halodurans]|uniref:Nickel/cobalt efflux system n=1 Tax=Marivibrio halodurans TaxID=2039722 RepID=A0A8J7RWZ5_9PROT|nr:high frequency lysogenization protein HflD [Marivibrio halodurans]MBP5855940.1 high frequency lysogenization protein HflD [Marivibrio halodurans]